MVPKYVLKLASSHFIKASKKNFKDIEKLADIKNLFISAHL